MTFDRLHSLTLRVCFVTHPLLVKVRYDAPASHRSEKHRKQEAAFTAGPFSVLS